MNTDDKYESNNQCSHLIIYNNSDLKLFGKQQNCMKKSQSVSKHSLVPINKITSLNNFKNKLQTINLPSSKMSRAASANILKNKGKVHRGSLNKPAVILSKDQRVNPFSNKKPITEELIHKKGIFGLLSMGAIPVNMDFAGLLNQKYDLQSEIQQNKDFFATNPLTNLQLTGRNTPLKQSRLPEIKIRQTNDSAKSGDGLISQKKKKPKSKRLSKQTQLPGFEIIEDKVLLCFSNFNFQLTEQLTNYKKTALKNGQLTEFNMFESRVKQFARKYNLKKFYITPDLQTMTKLTDRKIMKCIANHKLIGVDQAIKGSKMIIVKSALLGFLEKHRYKKNLQYLGKIEKLKRYFKIRKYYAQMIYKRANFLKLKLGQFAENQRRFAEINYLNLYRPEVQIHIISFDYTVEEEKTYYKLEERSRAHLLRLFNHQPKRIIFIYSGKTQAQQMFIKSIPINDHITIIRTKFETEQIKNTSKIYFGISPKQVQQIRNICKGKQAYLVPYLPSQSIAKLCEFLNVILYCGNYSKQSTLKLYQENQPSEQSSNSQQMSESNMQNSSTIKFKKIAGANHKQIYNKIQQNMKQLQFSNKKIMNKKFIKLLFTSLNVPTPLYQQTLSTDYNTVLYHISKLILMNRYVSQWMFKLSNSKFSRGLGLLQTESLKILKEKKRKPKITDDDIQEVSKIIVAILNEKLIIPHSSLIDRRQFMNVFLNSENYIEEILPQAFAPYVIFGRLQFNGVFTFLGTYKSFYTEEGVKFAAIYPAEQLPLDKIMPHITKLSKALSEQNYFGYISFELLFNVNSKQYYFIDLQATLDQYSSLYFFYKSLLKVPDGSFQNTLDRKILYCPFIDNNSCKCQDIQHFQVQCAQRKVFFNSSTFQGQYFLYLNGKIPDILSMICFSMDQKSVIRSCLDGLTCIVQIGDKFNKFDKKYKFEKSDGLYIMDMIWKLRQIKKKQQKSNSLMMKI